MTDKPPDAPYKFIYEVIVLDGKKYCVYSFGGEGKKMVEEALYRQQFNEARWKIEQDVKKLRDMLNVLTDIIGGPKAMVEYFKARMLVQLSQKSCRQSELVCEPYMGFKWKALEQLLRERKVHKNKSWIKL